MISRELFLTASLLVGVSFVVFGVLYLPPGNLFQTILVENAPTVGITSARPWYAQYFFWIANLLHGNMGTSMRTGLPVLQEVLRVGVNTLHLMIGSLFITLMIAIPIALRTARSGRTPAGRFLMLLTDVISALPVFWMGHVFIYITAHDLNLFPLTVTSDAGHWNGVSFLLPAVVLGVSNGTMSEIVRYLREAFGRVLSEAYIRTARAKGASVWKHGFKEGFLIPITEIVAAKLPFIIGSAVVVEQVFNRPGMGRMAWQAAQDRDYPLIMGITLAAAILVRIGCLTKRVVHIVVNPETPKT